MDRQRRRAQADCVEVGRGDPAYAMRGRQVPDLKVISDQLYILFQDNSFPPISWV